MIFSPIQLAFIKFLKACIVKNKAYGYINLTNKQIAERFEFKNRKYSESKIKTLLSETKEYFHIENRGPARQIYLSKESCITVRTRHNQDCNTIVTRHKLDSNQTFSEQDPLEPQGLEDPLLSIKNQDLINKNQDQVKEKNTKKKVPKNYQYTEEFEKVWSLYGRTGKKTNAFAEFEKAKERDLDLLDKLPSAIDAYKRSKTVKDGFKMHLENWLKQDCFDSYHEIEKVETVEELREKAENNERLKEHLEQEAYFAAIRAKNKARFQLMGVAA